MKSAKRWSLDAILSAGNVYASDGEDDKPAPDADPTGGTGQEPVIESGSTGEDDKEFTPEQLKAKVAALKEEKDRHFKQRQDAEKRADELQKKQDEVDRKGKTELENAKSDIEARDKQIETLNVTIRRLAVENAFVALPDVTWHNPATALKLVDLSDVEFDAETGKPKDMKQLVKAAKALAADNPYLVRPKTDASDDAPTGKPTGKPPANGKPNKGLSEDDLRAKYNINR